MLHSQVFLKDLSKSSVRGLNPASGVYKTPCVNQTHHGGNLGRLTPAAPLRNRMCGANGKEGKEKPPPFGEGIFLVASSELESFVA